MKKKKTFSLLLGIFLMIFSTLHAQNSRNTIDPNIQTENLSTNKSNQSHPIYIQIDNQDNNDVTISWSVNHPLFNHGNHLNYEIYYTTACNHYEDIVYENDWQTEYPVYNGTTLTFEWLLSDAVNPPQECGLIVPGECEQPIIAMVVYVLDAVGNSINSGVWVYNFKCHSHNVNCFLPCDNGIVATVIDIQGVNNNCLPDAPECLKLNPIGSGKTNSRAYSPNQITLSTSPNPFSSQTVFNYTLPEQATVSIHVFDIQGRIVANLLHEETQKTGDYQQTWSADRMPKGVYYYQLTVDGVPYTKKVVKL